MIKAILRRGRFFPTERLFKDLKYYWKTAVLQLVNDKGLIFGMEILEVPATLKLSYQLGEKK